MILIEKKLLVDQDRAILNAIIKYFADDEQKVNLPGVKTDTCNDNFCFSYKGNEYCIVSDEFLDITSFIVETLKDIVA